jgi:hypothetical protein
LERGYARLHDAAERSVFCVGRPDVGLLHVHGSNPNSTMAMPSWVAGRMRGFLSGVQLACGVVGIFRMAGTYNLIFIYTCELFLTVVMNATLGMASEAGQIGAIIAPLVVVMVTVNPSLLFAIIGVSGIVGGFLAFKLPETLHRPLYETWQLWSTQSPPRVFNFIVCICVYICSFLFN